MKRYLVVTLTCPDHPGVVERITEVIADHAANWEESRLAHLGGEFAGIVKISAPEERVEELAAALRGMADDRMTVVVKVTELSESQPAEGQRLFDLRLTGADHEGIVHRVAAFLAGLGVNVETMETELVRAPMSAAPLFHMEARINVPSQVSLPELNVNLHRIGDELGVDMEIVPAKN